MRFFEYIYLVAAAGCLAYIGWNYKHMETFQFILMLVGAFIASFMFSLRRQQRIRMEQMEVEENQEPEDTEEDDN